MRNNSTLRIPGLMSGGKIPHFAFRTPHSKGFTLVEIIITIVIVAIIAGIAAMIIAQGVRGYSAEQSRSDVHYQARLAVERMAREIRLVRSQTAADITTMNPTLFQYTDIMGNQMGFRLNGNNVERTQDNAVTWQALASNATALTFTYLQQDGVTAAAATNLWYVVIDVTDTQGAETLEIRTSVHPMNF